MGLIAGILGIGGGLLLGPMMLTLLKLRPEVQGSSTNVLVFSKSLGGAVQLIFMGTVYLDWALVLAILSLGSSLASKVIFSRLAKGSSGSTVFVLALLTIVGLAAVLTPALSIWKIIDAYNREGDKVLGFTSLCKV